jgi:hypothetical protein
MRFVCLLGLILAAVGCETTRGKPNPLFQPPTGDPFRDPLFATPPDTPEMKGGPGQPVTPAPPPSTRPPETPIR